MILRNFTHPLWEKNRRRVINLASDNMLIPGDKIDISKHSRKS